MAVHQSVPAPVRRVLEVFQHCFTTLTYDTFLARSSVLIAQSTGRTGCGTWSGARLAGSPTVPAPAGSWTARTGVMTARSRFPKAASPSRGHCFVIAAVLVRLPFLDRPIAPGGEPAALFQARVDVTGQAVGDRVLAAGTERAQVAGQVAQFVVECDERIAGRRDVGARPTSQAAQGTKDHPAIVGWKHL